MSIPFALDCNGNKLFEGDYVECRSNRFVSVRLGDRRRIVHVDGGGFITLVDGGGFITLKNALSPVGTSRYQSSDFKLVGRQSPHRDRRNLDQLKKGTTEMGLHVAIRIGLNSDTAVAADINRGAIHQSQIRADDDLQALKNWVTARIQADPTERWAVMTATTIAETSAPPVRFRAL